MSKIIPFDRTTDYRGRNGSAKQTGIEVMTINQGEEPDYIVISPVNSRGPSDACSMRIPIEHVTALANALLNISDPE